MSMELTKSQRIDAWIDGMASIFNLTGDLYANGQNLGKKLVMPRRRDRIDRDVTSALGNIFGAVGDAISTSMEQIANGED